MATVSESSGSVGFSHSVQKKKKEIVFIEFLLKILNKMSTIDFFPCSSLGKLHWVFVVWISFLSLDLLSSTEYKVIQHRMFF